MGTSTNGQIGFGIICEEDTEFPWDADEFEDGIEYWWRTINGWKLEWDGTDQGWKPYKEVRDKFDAEHPLPVTLINYCGSEYPMYMIAIPSSERIARRGCPEVFNPNELIISDEEKRRFVEFCDEYLNEAQEAKWYLTSYWG